MKKILVLTDFSKNSIHAAQLATVLAGKMHKNVLIYNSYVIVPVVSSYAGGPWVADYNYLDSEREESLRQLKDELRPFIKKANGGQQISIEACSGEGALSVCVENLIDQHDIELIVMGSSSKKSIDHFLNGRDTFSVVKQSTRPVLIIPPEADLQKLKKVIFATDFNHLDIFAARYLILLARIFNYHLEVVHVSPLKGSEEAKGQREIEFVNALERFKYPNISYRSVKGKDVLSQLYDLVNQSGADLLSLVHYEHSFITDLFRSSTTKKALDNQKIPMMIFSSKMEDNQ
jgi:nucleotide-binding universal stress UspA family protein